MRAKSRTQSCPTACMFIVPSEERPRLRLSSAISADSFMIGSFIVAAEIKIRSLHTVFWRGENASPRQRSQHPDIDFLDDIRPNHRIEGIQDEFASASRTESRLQNDAERWADPCRFQRRIVGFQRADRLYDEDSKDRSCLRRCLWQQPPVRCKVEGKEPTIRFGLSFDTPSLSGCSRPPIAGPPGATMVATN